MLQQVAVRRIGTVLAVVLLAATTIAVAQPAGEGPVPRSARWGVVDDHNDTSPTAMIKVRDAGLGWVRYTVYWNLINPAPGVYDWFALDVELANIEGAGLNTFLLVQWPPTWTRSNEVHYPNNLTAFWCFAPDRVGNPAYPDPIKAEDPDCTGDRHPRADAVREFATALATRYKGRVAAYGFGTEAHSRVFWQGDPTPTRSLDQFVDDLLKPAYDAIKAVDPSALVVGPDVDLPEVLEGVFTREAARNTRLFDVVGMHVFQKSGWTTPSVLDDDGLLGSTSLKHLTERYGRGRPLWLTELSGTLDWTADYTAAITARPWIDKTFFYRLRRDAPADMALIERDENETPTALYSQISTYLGGLALPRFYYLAEGAAGTFFDLDIALANPSGEPVPIKATFLKPDGTVLTKTPTLPARSRTTIRYEADVDPSPFAEVSTVVESTTGAPLAVERTMFWDARAYAGHTGGAVEAPSQTWYFAEGYQGAFDTFVLLANATTSAANVTITFLRETEAPVTYPIVVPANARQTVWAIQPEVNGAPALLNQSFAIRIDSDVPIIAERAMYFDSGGLTWGAGHESPGVPSPATTWFLAEGATGAFFDTYVLVGNPSAQDADVRFTFLVGDPAVAPVVATTRVGASKRFTLDVEFAPQNLVETGGALTLVSGDIGVLRNAGFSTKVESTNDVPIVVERAMYWPGGFGTWAEAHNAFGLTETGVEWALAEGRTNRGRGFETYILVANPSTETAQLEVTFLRSGGGTVVATETVAPTSRYNVLPPPALADAEFSVVVRSTNDVPIAVERAMYWNGAGAPFWAGGSDATAVKIR